MLVANGDPAPEETSKRNGASTMTFAVRLAPLMSSVCSGEAVPAEALNETKEPETSMRGTATTSPLTPTELGEAPLEATWIWPVRSPAVAVAATRAKTVVVGRFPPEGVSARLVAKTVPSRETSQPLGAVTVTLPANLVPPTVKVCGSEAVPWVVEKGARSPVTVKEGGADAVPLMATVFVAAPGLEIVMLPDGEPSAVDAARRTETVVVARVPPTGTMFRLTE